MKVIQIEEMMPIVPPVHNTKMWCMLQPTLWFPIHSRRKVTPLKFKNTYPLPVSRKKLENGWWLTSNFACQPSEIRHTVVKNDKGSLVHINFIAGEIPGILLENTSKEAFFPIWSGFDMQWGHVS